MGTRGYVFLKKGDIARGTFVLDDAYDIGDKLRSLSDGEIQKFWDLLGQLCPQDEYGFKMSRSWLHSFHSEADTEENKKRGYVLPPFEVENSGSTVSCFEIPMSFVPRAESDLITQLWLMARKRGLQYENDFSITWVLDVDRNLIFRYHGSISFSYPVVSEDAKQYNYECSEDMRIMAAPRDPHGESRKAVRTWHSDEGADRIVWDGDVGEREARDMMFK